VIDGKFVVQFPHPGGECSPGASRRQPWNIGNHCRKFLQSLGSYVADDGSLSECEELVFWGEWEAPSYIIERWEPEDFLPRFLHRPVWERPSTGGVRLNTDPWVFGDCFRYSNCRQLTPNRNRSALQQLTPGSLILFGSTIGCEFVIDTVFVVNRDKPCLFSPGEPPETDEAFRVCTVDSLLTTGNRNDPFTLYRGATYQAPFNGSGYRRYSFVPCRRADAGNMRFSRPSIELGSYVNPANTRAARGARTPRSEAEVQEQWEKIRKRLLEAGYLLGVWFSTPELDEDPKGGVVTQEESRTEGSVPGCGSGGRTNLPPGHGHRKLVRAK